MEEIKNLLEVRKVIKNRKPEFIRRDVHKKKKLRREWRKPTGLDSKIRRRLKGRQKRVSQGYRSPRKVRGMHKSGLKQVRICSFNDLEGLDPKKECLILSSVAGAKKKSLILSKAKSLGFYVVNSNIEKRIKKIEERIALNKKKKREEEKKNAKEPKAKEEVQKAAPEKAEDKKDAEKKEKDRILTKKEI